MTRWELLSVRLDLILNRIIVVSVLFFIRYVVIMKIEDSYGLGKGESDLRSVL